MRDSENTSSPDAFNFARYDVLGVPMSATTLDSACAAILTWAEDNVGRFVFIRDVHGIMQAQNDPVLLELHHKAAMVTPDGMPLVWLGKKAGLAVSRTCGPDLIDYVMAASVQSGVRHFLYGGKPGVSEALASVFGERYPGLSIVGTDTPPFRPLREAELRGIASQINESGADVVWVGLSTPKQEYLMAELAPYVRATLIGVGAAFDFHTGAVKRAPGWMQRSGLEWSYRLISEPRRLWRRYLIMAPKFVWLVATRSLNA
jgi:N-acetylglucosaminyldiphosphoundecaprenol N-acetyl-beta-D-mannosaminyltransferase